MTYIDVHWIHIDHNYPVRLMSELDDKRHETRKIELYEDGRIGYALSEKNAEDCGLSEEPIPSLDQINSQPEFNGIEIDSATFESLWKRYVTKNT